MSGINTAAVPSRAKPGFATADDPDTIFELTKKIGKGGFGEVFKGLFRNTGKEVALKIMDIESDVDVKSVEEEVKLIKTCDSPHVVKYYGSYFKKDKLWLAIEYCDAGSCLDVIRKLGKPFNEKQIRAVMRQVVSGVAYIHSVTPPICHRDIKAGNILLNAKGEAKIADFGISAQITATMKQLNTQIGSPYWMAPEVLSEDKYDLKVDIWSLGITAIELSQGKPPWFDQGALRALFLISTKPPPTLAQPENFSPEFSNFLECCLLRDPLKRWEARDLLNHPFLQNVDNRELLALITELKSKDDHEERDDLPPAPAPPAAVVVDAPRDPQDPPGSVSWMDVLRETKNSPKTPSPAPRASPSPTVPSSKLTPMPTKPAASPVTKSAAAAQTNWSGGGSGKDDRKASGSAGSGRKDTPTPLAHSGKVKSWFEFLTEMCGLSEEDARTYANTFKKNDIQEDQIGDINTQILKDLGVKVGHLMRIMKGVRSVKHS